MRADTIAAVGPDFVRAEDGVIERWEADKLPLRCIVQNAVNQHKLDLALKAAERAGFWRGAERASLVVTVAAILLAVLVQWLAGGL